MKGTIDSVWDNERKNGNRYLTVEIGGERYSVWDAKYFDQLQPGASIDYNVKESGNFKHLTDIMTIQEQNGPGGPVYHRNHKDRQIARLSCLKSASEILAPVHMEVEAKRDLVIDTARYFERYVAEDDIGTLDSPENNAGRGKNDR